MLAIIDPVQARAKDVLDSKLASPVKEAYKATVLFRDTGEYIGEQPNAVFIGTPPEYRGTMIPGRDVEIAATKKFPSSALFIEKPVSAAYPSDVQPLIQYFRAGQTFVAVGYMLRYLTGLDNNTTICLSLVVQKLKAIIAEKGIVVASTNAWYQSPYVSVDKGIICKFRGNTLAFWWNKSQSCGPIVEQATHLCIFPFITI